MGMGSAVASEAWGETEIPARRRGSSISVAAAMGTLGGSDCA
jgi:hypothetical protein